MSGSILGYIIVLEMYVKIALNHSQCAGTLITDIYRNIDKNDKSIDKKYFY